MPLREISNTNTQIRRLGYFLPLAYLSSSQYVNMDVLAIRFLEWGRKNEQYLRADGRVDTTGNIVPSENSRVASRSRSLNASKRYIQFAHNVGWLTKISNVYSVSRTTRVLLALDKCSESSTNPFILPLSQQLFFLWEIWNLDGDILSTVLACLNDEFQPQHELQRSFYEAYKIHLHNRASFAPTHEAVFFHQRNRELLRWRKPVVYAEHIVLPRLRWLLDLNLVSIRYDSNRPQFCLTEMGATFKEQTKNMETLTQKWMFSQFFKVVGEVLKTENDVCIWQAEGEQQQALLKWVQTAFQTLRRDRLPKLPISQVALFLSICLLVHEQVAIDRDDIISFLSVSTRYDDNHVIATRLSARENEAYFLLKPI